MDNTNKMDSSKLKPEVTEQALARQQNIIDQVKDGVYKPELSLLEQEYLEKAMIRQKEGIVKPQIVAGREFKGTSFISKPESITFKVSFKNNLMKAFWAFEIIFIKSFEY